MKVKIYFTNEAGEESLENIRYTDEIAEMRGMSDKEQDDMEDYLRRMGRYYLDAGQRVLFLA